MTLDGADGSMFRSLGLTGWGGIVGLFAGFAILTWINPIVALGVLLIVVGSGLVVHAAVRAIASRFGMADAF